MAAKMDLTQDEIQDLGQQINVAIDSVTNVDVILQNTRSDLSKAESVRASADAARDAAVSQLDRAETVTRALSEASEAQGGADEAVREAQADIDRARSDLGEVDGRMEEAEETANESVLGVADLAARSQPLQTDFIRNEARVKAAREAAAAAKVKASAANAVLYQLNNEFKNVSTSLADKTGLIGGAKDLAVDLQRRANELATSATNKLASIYGPWLFFMHSLTFCKYPQIIPRYTRSVPVPVPV